MPKFLVTPELARLARWLRALGFDAALADHTDINVLNLTCKLQNRILLTRMHKNSQLRLIPRLLIINSEAYREQLRQVVFYYNLYDFQLFSRCLYCNRILQPVAKALILKHLPDKVRAGQADFTRCPRCRRLYWPGDHYKAMLRFLEQTLSPILFKS